MIWERVFFLEDPPMFTLWGELASPLQESRFRLWRRENVFTRMRLVCFFSGIAYFLALAGDYGEVFPKKDLFFLMFLSRSLVFAVSGILALVVSQKNVFTWFPWALSGYMLLVGCAESFEFYVKGLSILGGNYFFTLIIVLLYYLFLPPRAPVVFAGALGGSLIFWGTLVFLEHGFFSQLFTLFLNFFLVNAVGLSMLVSFGRTQREEFLLLQRQQRINRRLSGEIEKRKEMEAVLREMALHDDLTGLCNRRHFFERFQHFWDIPVGSLGFLMMDLDRFKDINDRLGHPAGDAALAECARRFREALPSGAVLGRLGGEEFGVLLPEISLADLKPMGEKLRRALEANPVKTSWGDLHLTVSIGAALGDPERGGSPAELFSRADSALLHAKEEGRNRLCLVSG